MRPPLPISCASWRPWSRAGVLFWGWDVFALLVLFWMENVVVGLFFILRMVFADLADAALWVGKLFMVPFFCVHYGMFTAVHGVFVFMLFGKGKYRVDGLDALPAAARAADDYGLWLPLAVLLALKVALDFRAHLKEHSKTR